MNWNYRVIRTAIRVVCNTAAVFLVAITPAQIYTIDWSAFGSGGTSKAGQYEMIGVTTQFGAPDGAVSEGRYTLIPGFYSVLGEENTLPPLLTMEAQGAFIQLRWHSSADGFVLEQNSALAGNWSTVPPPYLENGTEWTVTVAANDRVMFYRLRKP